MLSVIVLTCNEEQNIPDCLRALAWADEILVVDSGSVDKTRMLAEQAGARVIERALKNFADQRNFALEKAKGDWVFFVDADERVTPELADELRTLLTNIPEPAVYRVPRHNFFFGKRIRFGDSLNDAPVRFFPRANTHWTQPVHETVTADLPVRTLNNPIIHYTTSDLSQYRQKVSKYIPLELKTLRENGIRPSFFKVIFLPPARFLQLYFGKLGILDGIAGFQYAILSACYTFTKHWQYWRQSAHPEEVS